MGNSEVLCWAAKWQGSEECYFSSKHMTSKKKMLKAMHELLEEADVVVSYNGINFDLKILNKEFLLAGLAPPSPYKNVDLLRVVRNRFRFTSNKLQYVAQQLGLGGKTKHTGHQLWLDCMAGDDEAWKLMEEYNIQDVYLLEALYNKLIGWVPNHPSLSVYKNEHVCPNCGGKHFQSRGTTLVKEQLYPRFQCSNKECRKWSRGKVAIKSDRKSQLVGIH